MKRINAIVAIVANTATAMIGYHIHQSFFWALCDFVFSPLAWLKWLICREVSLSIIKQTFSFFLG